MLVSAACSSDINGQRIDPVNIEEVKKRASSKVASRAQNRKRFLERKQKNRAESCRRLAHEKFKIEQRLQSL